MALTSTTIQQPLKPVNEPAPKMNNAAGASILAALMLAVFTAQSSKKALRRFKKQAVVTLLKYKMNATFSKIKSLFSKTAPATIDNRTLLYILLGVAILILLFISWPAAVVLLLLGILLVLLTKQ